MLAGMRVPIKLDHDLRLVLIAYDQDLLLDSRGMERAFSIQVQKEAHNETQDIG